MWFAFKLCSLYIWLQHRVKNSHSIHSCDLLSNFALCTFDYNFNKYFYGNTSVVICFQTLLFVHLITTEALIAKELQSLWFAFKLCSLYIWLQRRDHLTTDGQGCDLLSNFALCIFDYNIELYSNHGDVVVICFQTLLFVHLITTILRDCTDSESCDLLSNFALCTFDYNSRKEIMPWPQVVICFQTLLFVHLITTSPYSYKQ